MPNNKPPIILKDIMHSNTNDVVTDLYILDNDGSYYQSVLVISII